MSAAKVLIIEDEPILASLLGDNLEAEGYAVRTALDGKTGAEAWRRERPDLVVLDVMLPHKDGRTLLRERRAAGDGTLVLFLSAKAAPEERVAGLQAGGDDYLTKPFHLPEFLLRVRRLLERAAPQTPPVDRFTFGGNVIDFRAFTATTAAGRSLTLSEREVGVLRLLITRAGEVVSRDEILNVVWGESAFPTSRTVDNFILRFRRLFEPDPKEHVYFHTVWGVGYRFTLEPAPS